MCIEMWFFIEHNIQRTVDQVSTTTIDRTDNCSFSYFFFLFFEFLLQISFGVTLNSTLDIRDSRILSKTWFSAMLNPQLNWLLSNSEFSAKVNSQQNLILNKTDFLSKTDLSAKPNSQQCRILSKIEFSAKMRLSKTFSANLFSAFSQNNHQLYDVLESPASDQ